MTPHNHNWYVRSEGRLMGPFPAGLVSRFILLGRIKEGDLVSTDREQWIPVAEVPELIPEALRMAKEHPEDVEAQQHLEAARRWADERRLPHGVQDDGEERRRDEPSDLAAFRRAREGRGSDGMEREPRSPRQYAILLVILATVMVLPFLIPSQNEDAGPRCDAPPAPGRNWSNCQLQGSRLANADLADANLRNADLSGSVLRAANLQGADLAYVNLSIAKLRGANLRHASLFGANLRGADLANADLRGADLSYAILSGANLQNASLVEARLDNAQWHNDLVCMPGSVGECRLARPTQ